MASGFSRSYRVAIVSPTRFLAPAITVFIASLAGVTVSWIGGTLTPIWLGTAVIVCWLLRSPRRSWPAMIVVTGLANVAAGLIIAHPLVRCVPLALVNVSEALMFALPLRMLRLDRDFAQSRTLLVFYALVVGPATMTSAFLGGAALHATTGAPFLPLAIDWYTATALGQAMLVPPIMTIRASAITSIFSREQLRGTLLLLGFVVATIAMNVVFTQYPLEFLFFPAVMLLTFQRGFAGGGVGLLVVVSYMLVSVLYGDVHNALSASEARMHVIFMQLYTAVISFTVIVIGAGLEQRKRLERNLAAAREEALVARDAAEMGNRAKSMFLANMSHELRTPLNAVIGFSELMHRETYGPLGNPPYRDYAKRIEDAGRHLLDVIGGILDMSKIEAGKYDLVTEELEVGVLVDECIELMQERAARAEITLQSEIQGAECILADRRALKQILLNLVSNAIKFTPAGGSVTITCKRSSGRFVLAVSDTGIGIPATDLHRLGTPFVQLRRASAAVSTQPGTGLGLALVNALAERHGGRLRIESDEGRGTCVNVEIPLANPHAASIHTKDAA